MKHLDLLEMPVLLSVSDLLTKNLFYDNTKISFTRETNGHLIRQPSLQCSSGNKQGFILELLRTRESNFFFFFDLFSGKLYIRLWNLYILMIMAACRSKL